MDNELPEDGVTALKHVGAIQWLSDKRTESF